MDTRLLLEPLRRESRADSARGHLEYMLDVKSDMSLTKPRLAIEMMLERTPRKPASVVG
jgi:hypothetical protein